MDDLPQGEDAAKAFRRLVDERMTREEAIELSKSMWISAGRDRPGARLGQPI